MFFSSLAAKIWINYKYSPDKWLNIRDLWENFSQYNAHFSCGVAALFIEELILKYGFEKLIEFLKNQSYENAARVFGQGFAENLASFEKTLNSIIRAKVLPSRKGNPIWN